MIKTAAWSIIGGGLLTAGAAYLYSRRAHARRVFPEAELAPAPLEASASALELPVFDEGPPLSDGDIEVELVDLDTLSEEQDSYDAASPDDLGAVWLARATQTSGEHNSGSGPNLAALDSADDDDDLDPAGRPTDPPEDIESEIR